MLSTCGLKKNPRVMQGLINEMNLFYRATDSSEATQASDDSQDAARLFTASPPDQPSTPRSRTNR